MSKEINVTPKNEIDNALDDQFYLDVPKENFAEFVKGLLGKPFNIKRIISGQIDVGRDSLLNIINHVEQRIGQQNEGSLVSFNAVIGFEGGVVKTLDDLNSFKYFEFMEDEYSRYIKVNLVYLIKFPGKKVYERQEININLFGDLIPNKLKPDVHEHNGFRVYTEDIYNRNLSDYSIVSTERTWAEDIEKLIFNNIKKCVFVPTRYASIYNAIKGYFAIAIAVSGFGIPIVAEYFKSVNQFESVVEANELKFSNASIEQVFAHLEKLIIAVNSIGPSYSIFLFGILYFFTSVFFAIYISELGSKKYSFICYNEKMLNEAKLVRVKQNKVPINVLRDFMFGVFVSITASYVYVNSDEIFSFLK